MLSYQKEVVPPYHLVGVEVHVLHMFHPDTARAGSCSYLIGMKVPAQLGLFSLHYGVGGGVPHYILVEFEV